MARVQPETKTAPRQAAHSANAGPKREQPHVGDHVPPRTRTRQRASTVNEDPYYIPQEEIPEGSSYEWKRWSVFGQHDPFYIAKMRTQGWEPVNPKMHPNWLPPGYNEPHIIKDGQILMERPIELTEEARAELKQLSKRQVREAEQRLGMAPRKLSPDASERDLQEVGGRVTKEWGRYVAAEE